MAFDVKKWFMLQVWRIQQVAAVLTVGMLAVTLATTLSKSLEWRGGFFENAWFTVPVLILIIAAIIWAIAIIWDLRLKMWREQIAVTYERNPYAKEKMYSKEVMLYAITWLPIMDRMGKDDPNIREAADALRAWLKKATEEDKSLNGELEDLLKILGTDHREFIDWKE
jgi:uncharacterized membrane protein